MSQYMNEYSPNYSSLSLYNNTAPMSSCVKRYIVPTFGTPPGYTTGYCKGGWSSAGVVSNNSSTMSCGGYNSLQTAYPSNGCGASCGSNYVQRLCGNNCN